jgi:hypothetical protein
MRSRNRVRRLAFWATAVLAALGLGVWLAFAYVTDSATLAALIQAEAPRYLSGARLELGRVRMHWFTGEINLSHVAVRQALDGHEVVAVRIPWLRVRHDAWALLKRRFVPREVVVAQPKLWLRRRRDGTWNLQGLCADPWPGPPLAGTPPIVIQSGTVELADGDGAGAGAVPAGAAAILRDVTVRIEPAGAGVLQFEGTAKGDAFDRLSVQGTVELATGRVSLKGDLARLAISQTLRDRIPVEHRPAFNRLGLTGGEVDLGLNQVVYDPTASPALRYDVAGRLRSGVWNCPKLPFPINDLAARIAIRDGVLTIDRAEGYNGQTMVRVSGQVVSGDPARAPLDLRIDVIDLEIDQRLHAWTPPEYAWFWRDYQPRGRVSLGVHAVRARVGGPVGFGLGVDCRDVAMVYHHFKYPVDHVQGRLTWEKDRIALALHSPVPGLTARGTIDNPGPNAHVQLDFEAEAFPIDKTLFEALAPEVRAVVLQFHPTGTVRGRAHLERTPSAGPGDDPRGKVAIDAYLDLNEQCAITWDGLPYPVRNLTGQLELHPDRWLFKNMRGGNGQAVIAGQGSVEKVAGGPLKVDLHLTAERLMLDGQLRSALPLAWQNVWATLNPIGSSDVDARIEVAPGRPDHYHLEIVPKSETSIRLRFRRAPRPNASDPGGSFEMRMEDVSGRFVFDNGQVAMHDVGFQFHDAQVQFASGTVVVEDSGRFDLRVRDLWAKNFRLDAEFRKIMPPVMAQFARRADDGKTFTVKGNLALGWSGRSDQSVWSRWDHGLVVFNDNTIQAGLPLEHLQGQFENVRGSSDGETLEVHGALRLESISLLGQQVTRLESPFDVQGSQARLGDIRAGLLGGEVTGQFQVSLDATPRYAAQVALRGADLQRYAKTISGRQTFRGLVFGNLELSGRGNDLHALQGRGEAWVTRGDLGELPGFLRLVNLLNLSPMTKSAFDSAYLALVIRNGESYLDPIKFTGNAFSLQGRGTMGVQGDLDLRLHVLYGRDQLHLPIFSDALREASGQFFLVRVLGTPSYPKFKLEALPGVSAPLRALGSRRALRAERTPR